MEGYKVTYERWVSSGALDDEMQRELQQAAKDPLKLEDAFYKNLEFGTGGMRGEIGLGTNRINIFTIRKAAEGLARFIEDQGETAKTRGVVIAYDSRHKSADFAMEAARTLGQHGIQTYVFEELRPTPELSFAVRYLHAYAGIVITASHNPPEYNGFKVYGPDGGQLTSEPAAMLVKHVNDIADELLIAVADENELKESGLLSIIGDKVDRAYYKHVQSIIVNEALIREKGQELKIVFSPLHGTGNIPVGEVLQQSGFTNVTVVKEQEKPDPEFSTVSSPNPEEKAAFELAIQYGNDLNADVLLATDPDADRVGVAVKNKEGEFVVLTGNQTGALLLDYLLSQKQALGKLPANGIVFKTIVTSELGRAIAANYGVQIEDTLTGFKFIAEKINAYIETGEYSFLFGYEESYGYLIGDFVRDKDAVQTCLAVSEMAAYYHSRNMTLYDGLLEMFSTYGTYLEGLESLTLKGKTGIEKMNALLDELRNNQLTMIADKKVIGIEDYHTRVKTNLLSTRCEEIHLPKSNVIKYMLDNNSWVCVRPSGTEPKIKFYFGVKGEGIENAKQELASLQQNMMNKINVILEGLAY